MSMKHLMYTVIFMCITSHVVASILSGFLFPNCTSNQRSLTMSMSLIIDFHTGQLEPVSLNMLPNDSSNFFKVKNLWSNNSLCGIVLGHNRVLNTQWKKARNRNEINALTQ